MGLAWEDLRTFATFALMKGRLVAEILVDTGMRIGEVFALGRNASDAGAGTLYVHRTAHEGQSPTD